MPALPVLLTLVLAVQEQSDLYVRQDTWQDTMLACRESYLARRGLEGVQLGSWWATAPIPLAGFAEAGFPEDAVDLDAVDEAGGALWTEHAEWADGVVHRIAGRNQAATYLFRTLTVPTARTLDAGLGSDDGLGVWLNGEQILVRDVARGVGPDQDRATLELRAGENHLLLRIQNRTGDHGFYFSLGEDGLASLWQQLRRDFPREAGWWKRDHPGGQHLAWFSSDAPDDLVQELVGKLRDHLAVPASGRSPLESYVGLCRIRDGVERLAAIDLEALRRAVEDLTGSHPETYGRLGHLERLDELERGLPRLRDDLASDDPLRRAAALEGIERVENLRREALLANPLLDFETLLLVKRPANSPKLGLPQNWQGNCSLPREGFDDEIATLARHDLGGPLETLFDPEIPSMVADVDLDFDASRMLFSMPGAERRWQIWELTADGSELRAVTSGEHPGVDDYDACYLPDGRIVFGSTRCFQGVPCVGGGDAVANLYLMDQARQDIRRLCFDQDHDWCPTVLNDGRVLYTRWEYSDTPHYFSRLLFQMNPDGIAQMEFYGSNSFWPNSLFYTRPVPGHPSMVVSVVSGHHGVPRMGELVLLDPALGRREADGVVQRIPGFGETVEPIVRDQLVDGSWPKFLHPFPLSEKYFLVSCKPTPVSSWGIYLVDVFDNMLCLREEPGFALFEPVPLAPRPRPPVIPDRVRPGDPKGTVFLADVYRGPGLEGVPRGTVKSLRVYEFHYGYNRIGGHKHVGVEGPWDVHRMLGTVPVHPDGSASFHVPANVPIAVQPLDEDGMAVQLMRSWYTAMPGEVISCVGCHEGQNTTPPPLASLAARSDPVELTPWYGPARGFGFKREVQPVLDRHCVGCHDGEDASLPDLSAKPENGWNNFTPSYLALHPYVRRPGPESDYHLLRPLEFHASTSELVQMLRKGHHGVELDAEAWDRLVTWIDLNVPDHGTWGEHTGIPDEGRQRRLAMEARHSNRTDDPEWIPDLGADPVEFVVPVPPPPAEPGDGAAAGWPFVAAEAARRRDAEALPAMLALDLGDGMTMEAVLVPAGEFLMGDLAGAADELPRTRVLLEEPFYLGRHEVTLAQYRRFDPDHRNGTLDQHHKDHTTPGYPVDAVDLPVIRISWQQALAYCEWLSDVTGRRCTLPTEARWEWACRAGSDTAFSFGAREEDFSTFANLADLSIRRLAVSGVNPQPIANPSPFEDFVPKDARFDDGTLLMAAVGSYRPNAFGLYDMHGNVAEWTLSDHAPYPYRAGDGRHELSPDLDKVVRGGSWRDRPHRATASYRLAYRPYQRVYNVGFRVAVEVREVEAIDQR